MKTSRLMKITYRIITDVQFGFQPLKSTTKVNFVCPQLSNKKRLYRCFIDFKKSLTLSIDVSCDESSMLLVLEVN